MFALVVAACQVTPEQIARWKETERGPRKLAAALADGGLDAGLRAQALAALVELGLTEQALAALGQGGAAVVHEAVPRLVALAGTGGGPTTRVEREAKDALFTLRGQAAAADRPAIDSALIAWTTADLNGRLSAGGHSTEKILTAIGAPAAARLGEHLVPGAPDLATAAALFGRLADAEARARAADAFTARLRAAGGVPDEAALVALGQIGGPRATAYLVDLAERGPSGRRDLGLRALAQGHLMPGDAAARAAAVRIAGDARAPGRVREAAFELAEKLGPDVVPGLVPLIGGANDTVRWRAVEAALAAGGAAAVRPVLEALDRRRRYKTEDLQSYVVHDLVRIGAAAVAPLEAERASPSPVARQVAALALPALAAAGPRRP